MLTKELVRYRMMGGRIKPRFINPADGGLLDLAAAMLAVHDVETRQTRAWLAEEMTPLSRAIKDLKLAKGLAKLVDDACVFESPAEIDYRLSRRSLFEASAKLLGAGADIDAFNAAMSPLAAEFAVEGDGGFDPYADLPDNERLVKIKLFRPVDVLNRYNISLVQALLLSADSLTVSFAAPEPAKMRNIFKYLKFNRLLAEISMDGLSMNGDDGGIREFRGAKSVVLRIDGPASVLNQGKAYGLRLAVFFPAVCALERWRLTAEVKIGRDGGVLSLDESSGLICHYRNYSAHIPEEIRLFEDYFNSRSMDWKIAAEPYYLNLGGQELVFPDFVFRSGAGSLVCLELFHRWHSFKLAARLEQLRADPGLPLIIGVDRFLLGGSGLKAEIESADLVERVFPFRDFPGVDRVVKYLDRLAGREAIDLFDFMS